MEDYLVTLVSSILPLAVSLLTAVVGLIVTACKYKKQKYEVAMLEEKNRLAESLKGQLSASEISDIRTIIESVRKKNDL